MNVRHPKNPIRRSSEKQILNSISLLLSGGSVMNYYDARIIEGCCVFSYEVKMPNHTVKKSRKRKSADQIALSWKKAFLRFIILFFLPFAFLAERTERFVTVFSRRLHKCFRECFRCRELTACILSAISATALIPLALLLL